MWALPPSHRMAPESVAILNKMFRPTIIGKFRTAINLRSRLPKFCGLQIGLGDEFEKRMIVKGSIAAAKL
jgi:hypothetical protein